MKANVENVLGSVEKLSPKKSVVGSDTLLDQGLSKHQEVSYTPVTKVKKIIVGFWDLFGAIKR